MCQFCSSIFWYRKDIASKWKTSFINSVIFFLLGNGLSNSQFEVSNLVWTFFATLLKHINYKDYMLSASI